LWTIARVLLLLGIAWRILRYLLDFPLWLDEAFVSLNLLDAKSLGEALRPNRAQVAPVLFLWAEWLGMRLFGAREIVLRFLPLAASVAGLLLFARLARRTLDALGAVLAIGFLSVAYFPVRFAAEVKPYTLDLLLAVAFLLLARAWLDDPSRLKPLVLFALLAPLAVALSYPSVFLLATLGVVFLPRLRSHPDVRARALFFGSSLLAGAVFYATYVTVGVEQFESSGGFLRAYWVEAFPPRSPGALLAWLVEAHTGNLFTYPLGDIAGAGAVTFLLCVAGAVALWRGGDRRNVALLVLPFAFTLAAAALRVYPYGPHPRVAQHLAPSICLLAGNGLAAALRWRPPAGAVLGRARAAGVALAAVGVVGMAIDVVEPFKSPADAAIRSLLADLASRPDPPSGVVYVATTGEAPTPTMEFYLRRSGLDLLPSVKSALRPAGPLDLSVIAYPANAVPDTVKQALLGARPPFVPEEEHVLYLKDGVDRRPSVPLSVSRWLRPAS
jgi:hypothetical protein